MEESYHETADQLSYRKYIPWVTVFIGVFSIALFIGINTESNAYSWASYKKWGAATPDDVWNGAWWAL
ncbi:MAG: hypothetical protein K0R51_1826, partial [Cytophagaceae bacterium]|nr:hypothetical protein [Cytophagaceae bacterium]